MEGREELEHQLAVEGNFNKEFKLFINDSNGYEKLILQNFLDNLIEELEASPRSTDLNSLSFEEVS